MHLADGGSSTNFGVLLATTTADRARAVREAQTGCAIRTYLAPPRASPPLQQARQLFKAGLDAEKSRAEPSVLVWPAALM